MTTEEFSNEFDTLI